MAKPIIETDADIATLISELRESDNREEFRKFMRERKASIKSKGKKKAEADLKAKYSDKINKIKLKSK